ncbi:MAG: TRAP transporter substrate-binding protein [Spirochaetaceae bacterium]|jgi:TRAP-type C4-dicarboxylate transport system substrate-binding protein|nr:TRAP transporter substrate-binding protein [Spirochaetaceae bacterium]
MKKMLLAVAIFAGICAVSGCAKKGQAGQLTITVAHNQTSLENPYAYGANKFKEAMEEISGNTVAVIVHHGTLGENESELVEKLDIGAVDVVNVSPGFMTAIGVPEVDMLSLLYLFDSFDHWADALDGDFGDTMKRIISEKTGDRFRVLGYWSASVRDYYGKKKITAPADLKGMTIRGQSAPVIVDFWKACGAIPVSVAWGELYQALQQGVVDSAENDYTNFMLKEHHKTPNGRFVSETHHDYTTRLFMTSGAFWNKLTPQQQEWVTEAARIATEEERAVTIRMFEESRAKVIADGAEVTRADAVDIAAFKALALPIQDRFAQQNNLADMLEMARSASLSVSASVSKSE